MNISMVLLIIFCIIAEMAREICYKKVASNESSAFWQNFLQPLMWLGNFFWLVEMLAWLYVLKNVPLSIAFPAMSLSYIAIVFAAKFIFGEVLTTRHVIGSFLITTGVAIVGMSGV